MFEIELKVVSGMMVKEVAYVEAFLARYVEREGVFVTDVVVIDDEDGEWVGEMYECGEV